jgi:hypothetical protein
MMLLSQPVDLVFFSALLLLSFMESNTFDNENTRIFCNFFNSRQLLIK